MAFLSLRISIPEKNSTKMMQFDPTTSVFDACKMIREKLTETSNMETSSSYGLFLSDEDAKKGVWLEAGRNLDYYILRNGDLIEYKKKFRTLKVRMLDGSLKTLLVDDSQSVSNLMVIICTKIGITNHDEYSLVRDFCSEETESLKGNFGTLTLKKKKEDKGDRDTKMDQLRKKLKTDDEVNWIDPNKTLREQGVDETETVLLRRKFFFSDQNIDSRDPVQLSLLYVQARDAILDGTHPVIQDQACVFAGIQCQIQFGDFKDEKHKPGFLDLKEFLPHSYQKVKNIEKKIFTEHKKSLGLSELEAKVLYTKSARSLKTYGVTFFLVKEKMKGKNKLVPRLLGVTKDSVLRLDEKSKEILKTWPLTTVRRWGASPNTFTLDFGDYSDQYYSVQTTESEQILQLISGYIDIILKKQKSKDHFGIEGDEGSTMVEDSISPSKATVMQHEVNLSEKKKIGSVSVAVPAVIRACVDGSKLYETGNLSGSHLTTISGQLNFAHSSTTVQQQKISAVSMDPQRALVSTIVTGQKVIECAENDLSCSVQVPEIGSDLASIRWKEQTIDTHKQNIGSQIAAMNAATAEVVTLTSKTFDRIDHTAVGAAISTITSNLPEMTKGIRMIVALLEDDSSGGKLLDAARKLCLAFSNLLKAAEPDTKQPRQNLLNAASSVGEASYQVLSTIGEDVASQELQDTLLSLAKVVANTTAALVLKAKSVAASCDDLATQNYVISAATHCALATSQLVACSKVVAPTLSSPPCQSQLMNAIREVTKAVETLVKICSEICVDEKLIKDLSTAAADVTKTLNDLLSHIKLVNRNEKTKESIQEGAVETILVATDKLFFSTGDANEMVRQARIVGQATAQLIQNIKGDAENQVSSELQRKLLAAAKTLAEATAKMVEAARQCASCPQNIMMQNKLRVAVEELRDATTAAVTPNIRRNLIHRLEKCAKYAVSSATQCIAASSAASTFNTNKNAQNELNAECRTIVQFIPSLVAGIKGTVLKPDNPVNQLNLIGASEKLLLPGTTVVRTAKAVLPTITDQASALQLKNCSQQFGIALSDLRSAINRAREVCSGLEFDAAEEQIYTLINELDDLLVSVKSSSLKPLPGESEESTSLKLGSLSKSLEFSMAQLISAVHQRNKNYTENSVREISLHLKNYIIAVRGVAATMNQQEIQEIILVAAKDVIHKSILFIRKIRDIIDDSNYCNDKIEIENNSKELIISLNNCISCLPGQKNIDEAIVNIDNAQQSLAADNFPTTLKNYKELQNDLINAAAHLNEKSSQILSSLRPTTQLTISLEQFTHAYNDLLKIGIEMAGQIQSITRARFVGSLMNITISSRKYLVSLKSATVDPSATNAKNQLSADHRSVIDAINFLIDISSTAAPGQIECDNSVRNIQSMLSVLDHPNEPLTDATYFDCLETVMEKSRSLGDGMTGIANYAKKSEHTQFSIAIKGVSSSICGLIEAAGQAAYLAGVSDPTSTVGKLGIVDQAYFFRAAQSINSSCLTLENPILVKQEVLSAATLIAKHTSALCNACRLASSKTVNPVAKRHFVQSAKEVANSTAVLVAEIKALDLDYSEMNKQKCILATKPLLKAVNDLCIFASSPEFVSQPAKISDAARNAQEPIITAGKSIIQSSCAMILAAKSLVVNPKDPPTWQLLASHSKSVSDSIKALVISIRDKAPGQSECDCAIEKLSLKLRDLDLVSLNAVSQTLKPNNVNTIQGFLDQMESCASELNDKVEMLRKSAKSEAESVGHVVTQITLYCESLVNNGIGSASHMVQSKQQIIVLEQTKTVVECILQLLYVTKESGGNPKAISLHSDVDDSVDSTKESLQELQNTLETISTSYGIVTGLIDIISRAICRLEDQRLEFEEKLDSYVNYQTKIVEAAKEILNTSQEMTSKSSTNDTRLGPYAVEISHKYNQLVQDILGASATASNTETSYKLRIGVQELGKACADIIRSAGSFQMFSNDTYSQKEISDSCKNIYKKVSQVLATLHSESRGTQACINAASTVAGIIGDLDTTIMFATAGTLQAENKHEIFADHRENILKTAKALVEDTKTLVAGAASSQEQLAVAAQNAVSTIVELAEVVKFGAASLGNNHPEAQVMLINAIKDVASALGDLIHATKAASGKVINDPSMGHLKDSAKVMVTNVTSLLKTVKAVEDEHTRGTRALESTIEAITQEMKTLSSPDYSKATVLPEDIIRCAKSITLATSKAIAAGNNCRQDEIIAAANMGRKTISETVAVCKGIGYNSKSTEIQERIFKAGFDLARNYKHILEIILQNSSNPDMCKTLLVPVSLKITQNVSEILSIAEKLKGAQWVTQNNSTIVAENELLGAAASIDAAAVKLANIRPRKSIQEARENFNFDELILDAAKSIAAATSGLIKSASTAQKELIVSGKVSRTLIMGSDDGQWSEGLISAARMVAAATHSLVESANSLVQGFSTEEKLISSAKQVASSTAQLLVACKVKADPESDSTKRLQTAGNAVKRATDNLVRAAQQAIQHEEERSLILNRRIVGGIAQEINARSEVLRIERELEEARGRLTAIRQAKYRNRNECSDIDTNVETNYNYVHTEFKLHRESEQPSLLSTLNFCGSDELQSTLQNSLHILNEKESLISPRKVNSTQNELEKLKSDAVV